jgi:hypothetical protein
LLTVEVRMNTTWRKTIRQGLIAGSIGFLTVAIVLAVSDLAMGRSPLFTPALLGATIFHGATDPAQVSVTAANVLQYTALHLVVFVAFGVAMAALALLADRGWQLWFVVLFFFIFVSFHLGASVQAFAMPMRSALSDAAIWGAGIAASVAMALYLLWSHPRVRARQSW